MSSNIFCLSYCSPGGTLLILTLAAQVTTKYYLSVPPRVLLMWYDSEYCTACTCYDLGDDPEARAGGDGGAHLEDETADDIIGAAAAEAPPPQPAGRTTDGSSQPQGSAANGKAAQAHSSKLLTCEFDCLLWLLSWL